jgi:DmsE family decaheme c-type cytochrome
MVMARHISRLGPNLWLCCGFVVWLVAIAGARAATVPAQPVLLPAENPAALQNPPQPPPKPAPSKPAPQKPQTPAAAGATFVGESTCLTCHDEKKQGYFSSPHHRANDPRSPAAKQGCESCHGPGSAHVGDPAGNPVKRFSKLPPAEVNATCTTCHNRGEHALWDGSQHESRGLACTTCHSIHAPKNEFKHLKEPTQIKLCGSCHRDKVAKLDRSGHMPVREGKMECSTCHNPHGSTSVRLLRKGDSVAEMCTSCHADKRGPFLWEHAPARDGCTTCHDPHGSSNERMLVAKPPILCQRCHVGTRHPATIYDGKLVGAGIAGSGVSPSIRVFARSCVACHSAIHGSNHPSGQRFVR